MSDSICLAAALQAGIHIQFWLSSVSHHVLTAMPANSSIYLQIGRLSRPTRDRGTVDCVWHHQHKVRSSSCGQTGCKTHLQSRWAAISFCMLQHAWYIADELKYKELTKDLTCASLVPLVAGGHRSCFNRVKKGNWIWQLPNNRYAVVQFGEDGRQCTFVDYNHESQIRHMTVAGMVQDLSCLLLVSHVFNCQDDAKFRFKWLHGMTFVAFNFGAWETESSKSWTCHGHGQWRVKQDEFDLATDMHGLAKAFEMRQATS